MRTRFLLFFSLMLFAMGAWADTTVTWTETVCNSMEVREYEEYSRDGITISSNGEADIYMGHLNLMDGGSMTFTSLMGEISRIEIYCGHGSTINRNGWSTSEEGPGNIILTWSDNPSYKSN